MTIRARMLLIGLLITACLFYILAAYFVALNQEKSRKIASMTDIKVIESLSDLVHELQKERGISVGCLACCSISSAALLNAQHTATNHARTQLADGVLNHAQGLEDLPEIRKQVLRNQLTAVHAFNHYTLIIVEILDYINVLTDHLNTDLKNDVRAYTHLLYAKEYLGQIRASLNEVFSLGKLNINHIATVSREFSFHQHHTQLFFRDATPKIVNIFHTIQAQTEVQNILRIIELILTGSHTMITAEEWFTVATDWINQLQTVERAYTAYLHEGMTREMALAQKKFIFNAAIVISIALLLTLLIGSAIRRILHALNILLKSIEYTIKTKDFSNRIKLFTPDEIGVISDNFNKLLIIVESLIKEKDKLACTDLLTGIYNRYKFTEWFDIILQRQQRYGGKLALIVFDIDYFKQVNDQFGHIAGDQVLKGVAQRVQSCVRTTDIFARWGGEEFVILVPEGGHQAAVDLAERLRSAMESHCFNNLPKITASFGVSEYRINDTLETLFARADEAVYHAKHAGRNRVFAV